jgi:hypothetical protein
MLGHAGPTCLDELHQPWPAAQTQPWSLALGCPCLPAPKAWAPNLLLLVLWLPNPHTSSQPSMTVDKCHVGSPEQPPANNHCATSQETSFGSICVLLVKLLKH